MSRQSTGHRRGLVEHWNAGTHHITTLGGYLDNAPLTGYTAGPSVDSVRPLLAHVGLHKTGETSMDARYRDVRAGAVGVLPRDAGDTPDTLRSRTHGDFFLIGDAAALTGISVHALRAWERVGLLAPRRSAAGVRQYTEDDLARVRLIARTLNTQRVSRRVLAAMLASGELRPNASDYTIGRGPNDGAVACGPNTQQESRDKDGAATPAQRLDVARERRLLDAATRVGEVVASGRELSEVLTAICRETCEAFGVADALLWLVESGGESDGSTGAPEPSPRVLALAAGYGWHAQVVLRESRSGRVLPVRLRDSRLTVSQVLRTRKGLRIDAINTFAMAHPELHDLLPAATIILVPLFASSGDPLGVLALREPYDPRRLGQEDVQRAQLFANQAATAIETTRLHAAMHSARRQAEEDRTRWQAAMDNAPELVLTFDASLRLTYASPTYERMFGRSLDLAMAPQVWAVYSGLYRSDGSEPYPFDELPFPRALREQRPVRGVGVLHRGGHGVERLIVWDCAPMCAANGELLGAVAVGRDVTHEQRQLQRETCLAAVTRAAVGAPDREGEQGRMARVLAALVEHAGLPVQAASLHLYDRESDTLHRVGLVGTNPARDIGDQRWDRQHPGWEALTAAPAYSTDEVEPPAWYDEAKRRVWPQAGIRAWATVPLRVGNRLFGALTVGLRRAHTWDNAERAWIEACGHAVALALEYDQLFAAERRRAEELEAVLQSVSDGITVIGADGSVLVRNAAAAAITGRDEFNETVGERAAAFELRDALTREPVPLERTPIMRALAGETSRDVTLLARDTAGNDRLMLSTSNPVRDGAGRVVAAVTVFRDITKLQRMERMREEFLAVVAHELRTPLTSLLGFIHVIRRKRPNEEAQRQDWIAEYVDRIEHQALRLDRLVGDLLDAVRIQQGRLQYRLAVGDVAGAVAEAVDEQRAAHPDRRIELSLPDETLPARFDPDRVAQVVTNLVTNALKYSRTDRGVTVTVGVERGGGEPGEAIVRVRDAGTGIPQEYLERVFERFYRVPGVDVQSGSGIGLGVGLHVAHEIVRRHGGRIWVESEVGQGSCFNFTLPLLMPGAE